MEQTLLQAFLTIHQRTLQFIDSNSSGSIPVHIQEPLPKLRISSLGWTIGLMISWTVIYGLSMPVSWIRSMRLVVCVMCRLSLFIERRTEHGVCGSSRKSCVINQRSAFHSLLSIFIGASWPEPRGCAHTASKPTDSSRNSRNQEH
jgi:hypothetical protein